MLGGDTARTAVRLVEELKGAIGVDLPRLLESAGPGWRQSLRAQARRSAPSSSTLRNLFGEGACPLQEGVLWSNCTATPLD